MSAEQSPTDPVEGTCLPFTPVEVVNRRQTEDRAPATILFEAVLLRVPGHPTMRIQSTDSSTHGMGFNAPRAFLENELLAVKLRFSNRPGKLVLCRARYCRPLPGGLFHIGAEFLEAISLPLPPAPCQIPQKWLLRAAGGRK
jgi:hypothetical protein